MLADGKLLFFTPDCLEKASATLECIVGRHEDIVSHERFFEGAHSSSYQLLRCSFCTPTTGASRGDRTHLGNRLSLGSYPRAQA